MWYSGVSKCFKIKFYHEYLHEATFAFHKEFVTHYHVTRV